MELETTSAPQPRGIDRRAILKTVAWATPAIAVAAAMPLASASTSVPFSLFTTCSPQSQPVFHVRITTAQLLPAGTQFVFSLPGNDPAAYRFSALDAEGGFNLFDIVGNTIVWTASDDFASDQLRVQSSTEAPLIPGTYVGTIILPDNSSKSTSASVSPTGQCSPG